MKKKNKVTLPKVPNFAKDVNQSIDEARKAMYKAEDDLAKAEDNLKVVAERSSLIAAANAAVYIGKIISPKTWCHKGYKNAKGARCAMAHIDRVTKDGGDLRLDLVDALQATAAKKEDSIESWNDAPKRTWKQVQAGFFQASKWLQQKAKQVRA